MPNETIYDTKEIITVLPAGDGEWFNAETNVNYKEGGNDPLAIIVSRYYSLAFEEQLGEDFPITPGANILVAIKDDNLAIGTEVAANWMKSTAEEMLTINPNLSVLDIKDIFRILAQHSSDTLSSLDLDYVEYIQDDQQYNSEISFLKKSLDDFWTLAPTHALSGMIGKPSAYCESYGFGIIDIKSIEDLKTLAATWHLTREDITLTQEISSSISFKNVDLSKKKVFTLPFAEQYICGGVSLSIAITDREQTQLEDLRLISPSGTEVPLVTPLTSIPLLKKMVTVWDQVAPEYNLAANFKEDFEDYAIDWTYGTQACLNESTAGEWKIAIHTNEIGEIDLVDIDINVTMEAIVSKVNLPHIVPKQISDIKDVNEFPQLSSNYCNTLNACLFEGRAVLNLNPGTTSCFFSSQGSAQLTMGAVAFDHIIGTNQDDIIIGNNGDNKIFGMAGDDVINDSHGADEIDGGHGNNTYFVSTKGTGTAMLKNISTVVIQHDGTNQPEIRKVQSDQFTTLTIGNRMLTYAKAMKPLVQISKNGTDKILGIY